MFPTATVKGRGEQVTVSHGDDSGLFVRFYFNKIHDRHYVKINIPGDSRTEWDRPITELDKMRFSKQWEAYEKQQNQFGSQSMLKDCDWLTEHQVVHLNARNVHTVEHLAGMTDAMMTACGMGTRDLVKKAQGYLADLSSRKQVESVQAELKERDNRIAVMEAQMKEMKERMEQGVPQVKKRGGRPRKQVEQV